MGVFTKSASNDAEKVADIILTQARIEKLLTDIILEYIKTDTTGDAISTVETSLGVTYNKKLELVKLLANNQGNKNFIELLEKMGNLRNKIAHRDVIGELAIKNFNKKLTCGAAIEKIIGKQKTNKNTDLDHIYEKYDKNEQKVRSFFSADIEEQIDNLNKGVRI